MTDFNYAVASDSYNVLTATAIFSTTYSSYFHKKLGACDFGRKSKDKSVYGIKCKGNGAINLFVAC
jgi:hypothetical protein